jgi:SAM-dependent methyltransferase
VWESPMYKLNRPLPATRSGKQRYEQIVIDVTKSAPPFWTPGKTLERALKQTIQVAKIRKDHSILDFGAGKLRNSLFLLKQGYEVCAVEYEQLYRESSPAQSQLNDAYKYRKRFSKLIYPHEFEKGTHRFDLALLVNVTNIMPIPAERQFVLQCCQQKLRKNGYLLWYTQRGDADYEERLVPRYQVGDGYYVGRNKRFKTFYREFTAAEIDTLVTGAGFEFVRSIPATARNQARLYRRLDASPLTGVLTATRITSARVVDESIPEPTKTKPNISVSSTRKLRGNPNPDNLAPLRLLTEKLEKIPTGRDAATEYQMLILDILEKLFSPHELRRLKPEHEIMRRTKRVDICARNKSRAGFFHSLKEDRGFTCPKIPIECKNYGPELKNPEIDQLASRLGARLGYVGLLAFRATADRNAVIERCRSVHTNDKKLIIPLTDEDFIKLLQLKEANKEIDVEEYLDGIADEICEN